MIDTADLLSMQLDRHVRLRVAPHRSWYPAASSSARASAGSVIVLSSTISSPVPLPARSGTSYSITRATCATGSPFAPNASGTALMSVRSCPARAAARIALPAGPADLRVHDHAQVGAVGQHREDRQGQLGRGPPQQRRPGRRRAVPRGPGVEAAVRGQQLVGAQPRVQPLREGLLPDRVRVDLGRDERVGAALGQRDHPRLRERGPVRPGPGIPELFRVGRAVGHVDLEPVDGQQPPPAQERRPAPYPTRSAPPSGRGRRPPARRSARTTPQTRPGPAVSGPG